jgi:hypothetical protein
MVGMKRLKFTEKVFEDDKNRLLRLFFNFMGLGT